MNLTYAIVVEQTPNNYAAYAPDVPGCVTTADSLDAIETMMREALGLHIESMLEHGDPLPEPTRSIEEAIAFHSNALAEYGDPAPTISTTFRLLEVDIAIRRAARAS